MKLFEIIILKKLFWLIKSPVIGTSFICFMTLPCNKNNWFVCVEFKVYVQNANAIVIPIKIVKKNLIDLACLFRSVFSFSCVSCSSSFFKTPCVV